MSLLLECQIPIWLRQQIWMQRKVCTKVGGLVLLEETWDLAIPKKYMMKWHQGCMIHGYNQSNMLSSFFLIDRALSFIAWRNYRSWLYRKPRAVKQCKGYEKEITKKSPLMPFWENITCRPSFKKWEWETCKGISKKIAFRAVVKNRNWIQLG